jgi:hypothetical protein
MQRSERVELETFLRLFGQFDVGDCEFSDRPDLIILETTPLVGVEHTRIFKSNPELPSGRQQKPQERIQQQIADRARSTFRKTSSLPLNLTVSFAEPSDYRARDVSTVGDELAQSVSQVLRLFGTQALQGRDVWVEDWDLRSRGYQFPNGVDSFHFKVHTNPAYEIWGPAYGYAVPELSVEAVEDVIEIKEKRIGEYLSKCERVWLLIVTDTGMPSSHYDVPDAVTSCEYKTQFDKVFLMTCFNSSLFQLKRASSDVIGDYLERASIS